MNPKFQYIGLGIAILTLFLTTGVSRSQSQSPLLPDEPLGNVFTYQGRITSNGVSVTAACDFEFSLWDTNIEGNQIGTTLSMNDVPIDQGLFTVELDFGSSTFDGQKRWLQTSVFCPGDVDFTSLGRQQITAAPYAVYSLDSDKLNGHSASDFELASNVLYVFSSNSTTDGNAGGRSGMNAICTESDQASHFCNQSEIEKAYLSTGVYIASTFSEAWMDNVFLYTATNEMRWDTDTCNNWTNNTDGNGITMRSTKPSGKSCVNILPVTCCKWTP